ncbi:MULTISPECIES: hypothetical protein [Streptomyces]|uniref:Uncharacterized protein n=3 Tax=Streptomyces diastaticus group TaxID=2849069 RepID=A0A8H9LJP4_9ACTN|nr:MULTISPECIES: hypothetical protein [Streptomyces]NEE35395.1 hypothetical protein [Streptomyces sp. SID7982]NEE46753.1 hypothetical protein [Streptomyces sp. SID8455]MBL3806426.1 hypothetical protein [Streptomyces sp. BRB081]MDQ0295226.1 hypothetical protein [Streptomyces sp. DSM 41037]NEC12914.1 hypothetical protein [Streptomyces sp. SID8014]
MSFGDPNNPYGPPPQGQPGGYGTPQGQPGYGYPQGGQPGQPGYGYPQQPAYPGGPGGGFPTEMPGLLQTARVLLFIVGAVQVIGGLLLAFGGAFIKDASSVAEDSGADLGDDNPFGSVGDLGTAAAGVLVVFALVCLALAVLSIMLGVKFSNGAQGVRITTIVYGAIGGLIGLLGLLGGLGQGAAGTILFYVLWVAISGIWIAAMVTEDGRAWFNRPRY